MSGHRLGVQFPSEEEFLLLCRNRFSELTSATKEIAELKEKLKKSGVLIKSLCEIDKKTGCWVWSGKRIKGKYGAVKSNGTAHVAHRLSYEMFVGPIPEGMLVCHHCDNPPCINPDHLFVGSHSDNMKDCFAKGRQSRRCIPWDKCKNGHEMTEENVYLSKTGRQCKKCKREYNKDYRQENIDELRSKDRDYSKKRYWNLKKIRGEK